MNDVKYMKRALRIARKGAGKVSPNPLVGAVIVKSGTIAAEGFHEVYGSDHAEVNALKAAGGKAKNSVLYCNLEPCNHRGNTPPCTDAIIKSGITKVVIGLKDPNPKMNGNGIRKLRDNGIEVRTGVLEDECRQLNSFYHKYITSGMPFITVKMAQSLDGIITPRKSTRYRITSDKAIRYVHKLRAEYDAVLIGRRTAEIDNPFLTVRLKNGRNPVRILLDTELRSDPGMNIFNSAQSDEVIIATASRNKNRVDKFKKMGVEIIKVAKNDQGMLSLTGLAAELGKRTITSVLVEGGAGVFAGFIRERLVDRVIFVVAPVVFGKGVNVIDSYSTNGSYFSLKEVQRKQLGIDSIIIGKPEYSRV